MADQLGANVTVTYKVEGTYATAPGASGATRLRMVDSPGMNTEMSEIKSAERRSDLLDTLARMGSRRSPGSYSVEMGVGSHDVILEAAMRSTWTAPLVITQATAGLTSISTPTTSTIVASAGSWITAGVKVGDVVRLTNFATVANNNINLRVKTVTALTLTVHGTPLTVDASLDTTFTLTVTKKLVNPTTPTRRTFYVEQRYVDANASLIFPAARWMGLHITGAPDGMALMELPILGGVPGQVVSGAAYYTSPTVPTGQPLTFADCILSFDGTDIAKATAFDLNYSIAGDTGKFLGASTAGSPDVYDSKATLSGSITVARSDLAYVTKYLAESPLELSFLLTEPESEPKDFISVKVPNLILNSATAPLGGDSFMPETRGWTAGVKEGAAATGYDQTLLGIWTSAP